MSTETGLEQPIRDLIEHLDVTTSFELIGEDRPVRRTLDPMQIQAMKDGVNRWLKDLFEGSKAASTVSAIISDLRHFIEWCKQLELQSLPAEQDTLDEFFRSHQDVRRASTLRRYASSIGQLHEAAALPNPCRTKRIRSALDVIQAKQQHKDNKRRDQGEQPKFAVRQATGFREDHLVAMDKMILEHYDGELEILPPRVIRDLAVMWVAHDTLLRGSELRAIRVDDFDTLNDGGYSLAVVYTKTIKDGRARHRYVSPHGRKYVDLWLETARLEGVDFKKNSLVFRTIRGSRAIDETAMSRQAVWRLVKKMAKKLGLEGSFSAHSTRVGTAQDMMAEGINTLQVMQAGGWKTEVMPQQYGEAVLAQESGSAELARLKKRAAPSNN